MDEKLNILYVANSRIPTEKAHGKQIAETCQALADKGCNILLLLPARKNYITENIFDFYGLRRNFAVKKLTCLDLLFLPFGKSLFFFIQSVTFALSTIFFCLWTNKKFDIVYTRDLLLAGLLSFGRRAIFVEIHDFPAKSTFIHHMMWRKVKGIIVISQGLKEELVKQGITDEKILVARDGVRLEEFDIDISRKEARLRLNLDLYKKIVLYTGHLYDWKGADLLAEAATNMSLDVRIYIVGGTAEDVTNFKRKFKAPNLFIVGHRPPQEIPIWLKAADLLVLPNRADKKISSHYTSPLKLFEYMASDTPMIVSDLPSLREVVGDNEAVFFTPGNKNDLTQKIITGINNKESLTAGARLVQTTVRQYSWENRSKLIKKFILDQ
ncbi:MAG: glycosyltransferase [bacterium]|nr:glycosyltransferase [bacterium]